ncbi:hypothetical protein BIW11_03004 [Tropilaelaps mercedesae]|uniref:Uncharacterized protein n=1 Tax=Tropilaelaps mercedesae TaxID=418985 RepID=A0A1V9XTK0_9ACAR|nr:hypothetical protein BIW11_03004 [Tropilaelaps mercedesae]
MAYVSPLLRTVLLRHSCGKIVNKSKTTKRHPTAGCFRSAVSLTRLTRPPSPSGRDTTTSRRRTRQAERKYNIYSNPLRPASFGYPDDWRQTLPPHALDASCLW